MLLGLDLNGKDVIVAGGGEVASRRVETLLEHGAKVTVIAPQVSPALTQLVEQQKIQSAVRPISEADMEGAFLVVAATDSPATNQQVAGWAGARATWCVNASNGAQGSARFPAQGTAGDVLVGVTSIGSPDPGRVALIRDALVAAINSGEVPLQRQRSQGGSVTLVGAGPGAGDLITVRGARAIAAADVVVHDRLGTSEILANLPQSVKLIDVGKRPDDHPVPQVEINRLIVEHAKQGKSVVRLKGGDPFVFGRGGEEVQACIAEGVPVSVIPGITSAIAAPSAASIPVTHRGTAASFHVTTGHAGLDQGSLQSLLGGATLVVLMGVGNLENIAQDALQAGVSSSLPVAVIERGTLSDQRVTRATLATLVAQAARIGIANPAVIVFGDVVATGLLDGVRDSEIAGGVELG